MAFRPVPFRLGSSTVTIMCGKITETREKSVACMRGDRKIFIPRSYLRNPDLQIGDRIGEVVISFHLARKFGLLA